MSSTAAIRDGGCLCGAVRYRLSAAPADIGYCHCTLCRRSSGAPVQVFGTVPLEGFRLLKGEPRRRRSSGFGERWFCADCGTQIAIRVDFQPDTIDFTVGSLDDPGTVAPRFHLWTSSQIPWFDSRDDLPRYTGFRPHTSGLQGE
jgi:hypothetical protein